MSSDHLYALRTYGSAVIRGALDEPVTSALRAAVDRLLAEDDRRWGPSRLNAAGQRGALRNLPDRGTEFERLLDLPVLHRLATDLLGPGYRLHSYDALVLVPGEGRFPWDFHTDLHGLAGVAFPAALSPGLNCLVGVDATTAQNGATWLVPGSHHSTIRDADAQLLAGLAEQPELAAGDLLLFDARIWHCAGHNGSDRRRRLIKIEMVQPWLRPQMDYARSMRPEVLARLGPDARAAVGQPLPASAEDVLLNAERR